MKWNCFEHIASVTRRWSYNVQKHNRQYYLHAPAFFAPQYPFSNHRVCFHFKKYLSSFQNVVFTKKPKIGKINKIQSKQKPTRNKDQKYLYKENICIDPYFFSNLDTSSFISLNPDFLNVSFLEMFCFF